MCDYSLHGIENRLAVQGETLVVYRFPTGTKGLTSPNYLKPPRQDRGFFAFLTTKLLDSNSVPAVCIPDGAKLGLTDISPQMRKTHSLSTTEPVTFRQMSISEDVHRDAVEFENGTIVGLQDLDEGQHVEVFALSSDIPAMASPIELSAPAYPRTAAYR